jgi:drug resistance transporter, Bcr/CflA subfamily
MTDARIAHQKDNGTVTGAPGVTRARLLLLAGVTALGSLAMQLIVPALPAIAAGMHVGQSVVQLAVAIYVAGLGLGQLVFGPLSDILGRKPVLLAGLALFCIASVIAALASDIQLLLAARFLQALGASAGIVSSRAIIADLSRGAEAVGHIAMLTAVTLLSPLIAPSIGGVITGLGGWRIIFALLAVLGTAMAGCVVLRLPSTGNRHTPLSFQALPPAYGRLIRNSRYRRYVLTSSSVTCALYVYLSGSPFLLINEWDLSPEIAGLYYLGITSAGIFGTFFVRSLEERGGALGRGLWFMAFGAGLMFAAAVLGYSAPVYFLIPMMIVLGGSMVAGPPGVTGAMNAEANLAGTASSLAGAFQMLLAAIVSAAYSAVGAKSFLALAATILFATTIALVLAPAGRSPPSID